MFDAKESTVRTKGRTIALKLLGEEVDQNGLMRLRQGEGALELKLHLRRDDGEEVGLLVKFEPVAVNLTVQMDSKRWDAEDRAATLSSHNEINTA
jgi:hypothetical protein